jgi:hypothetical protein
VASEITAPTPNELPLDDWCELTAVKYAMEMAIECERQIADY